jgi:hypothetical protein
VGAMVVGWRGVRGWVGGDGGERTVEYSRGRSGMSGWIDVSYHR